MESLPRPRTTRRSLLREILDTLLMIVAIYTLINLLTARFVVEGSSMNPNFASGQFIIVNRLSYLVGEPRRGDVVVFVSPDEPGHDFIKRVLGLPGETVAVRDGLVYINEEPLYEPYISAPPTYQGEWTLGADEYFVLGDNRNNSRDSHAFGPLRRDKIVGQAWVVYWPLEDWGFVPHYDYDAPPPHIPTPPPQAPVTAQAPAAAPLP